MISERPVASRASRTAVSFASVPEVVKKLLLSGPGRDLGQLLGQLDLGLGQVQRRAWLQAV